jgi:hypothetical protein
MPHPAIHNHTPFAFETLFINDEEARPQCVPLLQATYAIGTNGALELLAEQPVVNLAGKYWGDPAKTSIKHEAQIAFAKAASDVVMIGHAHAPDTRTSETQVGLRVGTLQKLVRVVGDRVMTRTLGRHSLPAPAVFEKIPLRYERAFGGVDAREPLPDFMRCDPRNPVGMGYRDPKLSEDEVVPLPNIEDPQRPFKGYGDTPPPAGFGFIAPNWQPRLAYAGTYDEAWDKTRKPLLPQDFDRRFFNAASPGLIAPGFLRGDEEVVVINASPEGRTAFRLPDTATPGCMIELRGRKHYSLPLLLDTLIVDMDVRELTMIRRACIGVRNGPHDVVAIHIEPRWRGN